MDDVLSEIDTRGKKDRDPFTFFYEDFLSIYDPEKRKHLGVYYTPRPVVPFIVNSINQILKNDFGKLNGFADDDVTVLDPAVGTGTFLWLVYILTLTELKKKGLSGLIRKKIESHILHDFYGIEILITPYIIAHLKLSLVLKKWFYDLKDNERTQIYLANTLEPFESHGLLPFLREISEESRTANELKLKKKILVITANPPYHGMSANKGQWIEDLLKKGYSLENGNKDEGYYRVDGKPLEERNPKWLQDDYVKFIRFAQWKIDTAKEGVIGFVTNHSYLDSPTFRGMRQSLLKSFDGIYILNLHGSSLRRRRTSCKGKDENVFNIRLGVAISIFEKKKGMSKKILYSELYGKREEKYSWLDRHDILNTKWQKLEPKPPYYFFVPKDERLLGEYEGFTRLDQIFDQYSLAVQTHRDSFAIDSKIEVLEKRLDAFGDLRTDDDVVRKIFSLKDTSNWKLKEARKAVNAIGNPRYFLERILYRPFDNRWLFYHDSIVDRPRRNIMKHVRRSNIALLVSRQLSSPSFKHVFVSDNISDAHVISNRTQEGNYHFPLNLYFADGLTESNINKDIRKILENKYGKDIPPEMILYYIYAVLHSTKYREKYAEFLQLDFPRIPFAEGYDKFTKVAALGKELVDLHLMRTRMKSSIRFDIQGSNMVEFIKYRDAKIFINEKQFFENIPENVWNFQIGAYRVLEKWLKDRKNTELPSEKIEHFIQMVEIINKTIKLMQKIDEIPFLD